MQHIMSFEYENQSIRVMRGEDGKPWFVVVDVCKVLGLGNPSSVVKRLENHEKALIIDPATVDTGINNVLNMVNEQGLYTLALTSRKPKAKAFKQWITQNVFPTGHFSFFKQENENMKTVMPFAYHGQAVRVISDQQDNPWWVASDVCKILALTDTSVAMRKLDDDEKMTLCLTPGHIEQGLSDNSPGTSLNLVNEPGLYRLILTSRKPEAKAFKRWLTHEVLPSIRMTGGYQTHGFHAQAAKVDALRDSAPFLKEVAKIHRTYLQLYRGMQLKGPQLVLAVQNAFRVNFGIELSEVAPMLMTSDGAYAATVEDRLVTPTYLGKTLELRNPGKSANDLLEKAGLMERDADNQPCPTPAGKALGDWIETGKRHHSGAPILAWRWKEWATLEKLQALI